MYTPSMIAAASVAAALHGLDWTGKSGYGLAGLLDELTRITAIEQVSNVRIRRECPAANCNVEDQVSIAPLQFTRLTTNPTFRDEIFSCSSSPRREGPRLASGARREKNEIGKKRWNLPFASLDSLRQTSRGAKNATGSVREGCNRCRAHVRARGEGKKMGARCRARCGPRMLAVEDGGDEIAIPSPFLFPLLSPSSPFPLPFLLPFFLYTCLAQINRANEWGSAWGLWPVSAIFSTTSPLPVWFPRESGRHRPRDGIRPSWTSIHDLGLQTARCERRYF